MAGLGQMGEVTGTTLEARGTATAQNVVVQVSAPDDQQRTAEVYAPAGVAAAPTPGDRTVALPIGQGGRIVIAVHNYKIEVPVEPGEVKIYSTDATGEEIKSSVYLRTDGSIEVDAAAGEGTVTVTADTVVVNANMTELGGNTKSLVTHAELDAALQQLVTALSGHTHPAPGGATSPPPPFTLNIANAESTKVTTG